ncbi:MAG: alpha/beta hydrolase [Actinomycetota bacterium]
MTELLQRPEGRIAYDVAGTGPLVVCVPGMGDLRSTFRHVAPALRDAGFRVATMDLRGHGDSDTTFSAYDDVAAAGDVTALIEDLSGPAVIIGNSMGAGAAALVAAERPDLVAGLALLGPFVRNPPGSAWMGPLFAAMLMRPWGPAALKMWLPKLYAGSRPDDHDSHVAAMLASARRPGHWSAFTRTARTSHAPVAARLSEVCAPTLVVMGERDPDFKSPAREARWIADTLHAEVVMVPDAGHYPQAQRADVVGPALVGFAQRVSSRA